MKNKIGLGALFVGVPLATLGIVGSAVFAQSQPSTNSASQLSVTVTTGITADQAKAATEAKLGGTASSVALDDDKVNGHAAYEVKINGQEVKVDGQSGSVISIEKDDGDANADEKDANEALGTEQKD